MNKTEGILEDLRKITMLTGEISTIHQQNMMKWPYLAFDGVDEVEIRYDLTKDYTLEAGEGYMHFHLTIQPEFVNQELIKERCEKLTEWIKDMLWSEIRVKIFFNEVLQYTNSSLDAKEINNGPKQD